MGMYFHHWFEDDTEEDRSIKLTKKSILKSQQKKVKNMQKNSENVILYKPLQ